MRSTWDKLRTPPVATAPGPELPPNNQLGRGPAAGDRGWLLCRTAFPVGVSHLQRRSPRNLCRSGCGIAAVPDQPLPHTPFSKIAGMHDFADPTLAVQASRTTNEVHKASFLGQRPQETPGDIRTRGLLHPARCQRRAELKLGWA